LPAVHPRPLLRVVSAGTSSLSRDGEPHLGARFALRCLQRFSPPDTSYGACGPGQNHSSTSGLGVPVLSYWGRSPASSLRPRRIETELSHDVLNPARVPLSWANSPTLGTCSSPRMRRADIEVPNLAVDVDSRARSACYPRGSFYPLCPGPATQRPRITWPAFRPCSGGPPHSQARFCPCTPRRIAIPPERTFARLRYPLGGDRPSQTAHQPRSQPRLTGPVRTRTRTGWYFTAASAPTRAGASLAPTYPTQHTPQSNDRLQ